MVKVRMLETVDTPTHLYRKGDEVELDDEEATRLLNAGQAEPLKEKRETATDPAAKTRERGTR